MRQVVHELCCSEIKITFNFKLKLVFIEKITGRKPTYKLRQDASSNLNLNRRCKVFTWSVVFMVLLSDIFQLSVKQEKLTVYYSLFSVEK